MDTRQIPARDVQEGQQLTAVPGEELRPRRDGWPTVTAAAFLEDGEGGQPTVYIETHEMPGWTYCLHPGDPVTVLAGEPGPVPWTRVLLHDWTRLLPWAALILIAVAALALTLSHHAHHGPAPSSTPDVPPAAWTVACTPAAIGDVCHTYPPGDERWQPAAPLPPRPPLPTPWPGGEDAR